jgi:hypothetical protein
MNEKPEEVFSDWLSLSLEERQEVQNALLQYTEATESHKAKIRESLRRSATKMQTGRPFEASKCW